MVWSFGRTAERSNGTTTRSLPTVGVSASCTPVSSPHGGKIEDLHRFNPMSMPTSAKAAARLVYSWTFPGAPLRITLPIDLVSRLQAEIRDIAARSEAGGVLFGHQEARGTLDIDDYVWVSPAEGAGNQYVLDAEELERVRNTFATGGQNTGTRSIAVGYFRTHPEGDLQLRGEEIDFLAKNFPDPANAVLLIGTSTDPFTAGFFFWMHGGAFAPFSFMDFPFDADFLRFEAQLRLARAAGKNPLTGAEPPRVAPVAIPPPEAAAVEPANVRPEEPDLAPPVLPVFIPRRTALPPSAPPRPVLPASVPSGRAFPPPGWIPPELATVVLEPSRPATPIPKKKSPPIPETTLVKAAIVAVALCAGLCLLVVWQLYLTVGRQSALSSPAEALPLQLDVEAQGDGLNVRWNTKSSAITKARDGRLLISGSDRTRQTISLDQQQLAGGHIYYRSKAERLQFELEVVGQRGEVSKESVLAVSARPGR